MRKRSDLIDIMTVVVLASIFPVDLLPSTLHTPQGSDGQLSGKQGEVMIVKVPVGGQPVEAAGEFLGRRIPFYYEPTEDGEGRWVGLVGIDMMDRPGTHELMLKVRSADSARRFSYNVLVLSEEFPVQHLNLPKAMVDLDQDTLVRVKAEQKEVRAVLGEVTGERLWRERFIVPVEGTVSGAFGRKRVINGQARNPHNGEDISAPAGTDVRATNDGVVRLAVDHFFSGKGVFIDHGLGLYSMYFHLSEISVQDGNVVKRGQRIGKVGASGRVTGPHLHWGVRLNGARVNPYSLTRLSFASRSPTHP
ncbi:MAG: M23 family metallopeptidase [Nitrospiraceae bacterium]